MPPFLPPTNRPPQGRSTGHSSLISLSELSRPVAMPSPLIAQSARPYAGRRRLAHRIERRRPESPVGVASIPSSAAAELGVKRSWFALDGALLGPACAVCRAEPARCPLRIDTGVFLPSIRWLFLLGRAAKVFCLYRSTRDRELTSLATLPRQPTSSSVS